MSAARLVGGWGCGSPIPRGSLFSEGSRKAGLATPVIPAAPAVANVVRGHPGVTVGAGATVQSVIKTEGLGFRDRKAGGQYRQGEGSALVVAVDVPGDAQLAHRIGGLGGEPCLDLASPAYRGGKHDIGGTLAAHRVEHVLHPRDLPGLVYDDHFVVVGVVLGGEGGVGTALEQSDGVSSRAVGVEASMDHPVVVAVVAEGLIEQLEDDGRIVLEGISDGLPEGQGVIGIEEARLTDWAHRPAD